LEEVEEGLEVEEAEEVAVAEAEVEEVEAATGASGGSRRRRSGAGTWRRGSGRRCGTRGSAAGGLPGGVIELSVQREERRLSERNFFFFDFLLLLHFSSFSFSFTRPPFGALSKPFSPPRDSLDYIFTSTMPPKTTPEVSVAKRKR